MPKDIAQLRLSFENEPVEVGEESEKISDLGYVFGQNHQIQSILTAEYLNPTKSSNRNASFVYFFRVFLVGRYP